MSKQKQIFTAFVVFSSGLENAFKRKGFSIEEVKARLEKQYPSIIRIDVQPGYWDGRQWVGENEPQSAWNGASLTRTEDSE